MNSSPKPNPVPPKRRVQRHSPDRLLRQTLVLPGEITVSAEKHKGRLVVRFESPAYLGVENDRQIEESGSDGSKDSLTQD
ncbi:MAG: hypothetical protein IAF94_25745 [Pirellulaceae bacterium]|nr:hypothetical protein [Pirellulaceae bacterium]